MGSCSPNAAETEALAFDELVQQLREREYPSLLKTTYLDHAGTTLYAKSLIERFAAEMMSNLFGNPHSASVPSQLTTRRIENVRMRLLDWFNADPEDFDVVFVANATAGIKLVHDALRDQPDGFWYGYHRDSHTSLVGMREGAAQHRCFGSDDEVDQWISEPSVPADRIGLFAYPAQSNMNGRRLPRDWCFRVRSSKPTPIFTMLDAAALVPTAPLDLGDAANAPDFMVVSLYKMFGFPDLGALVVRTASGHVFDRRRYFGGGTVELVVSRGEDWHAKKSGALHQRLEDGTLPIHNVVALGAAMDVHQELFGTMERVCDHCTFLAKKLHYGLTSLCHRNGTRVCQVYQERPSTYGDASTQGPILAFNVRNSLGGWVSHTEVGQLAAVKNIQLRTGGVCNPGGISSYLDLAPWQLRENFSAGIKCGSDAGIVCGKPTGVVRISLGAMSTLEDVNTLVDFVREFYIQTVPRSAAQSERRMGDSRTLELVVESVAIYPIKSCAGWAVPRNCAWELHPEGLAWDREWCLVHQGTGAVLNQKRYPRMALLQPSIDLDEGVLRIRSSGPLKTAPAKSDVVVPLSSDPRVFDSKVAYRSRTAKVCGDTIQAKTYRSPAISNFLSQALGVPCHLARFPAVRDEEHPMAGSFRHSKAHLTRALAPEPCPKSGEVPNFQRLTHGTGARYHILLSNESPILAVSQSSLGRLNECIRQHGGKESEGDVFRANVVLAPKRDPRGLQTELVPYAEDDWRYVQMGDQLFDVLGPCRRCHMVCVDQRTAELNEEPFVTLSKTRRFDGKVLFGVHMAHVPLQRRDAPRAQHPTLSVGDAARAFRTTDEVDDGGRPTGSVN